MLRGFWHGVKKFLPYFLMFEGVDHFVFSTISVVGMSAHHVFGFFSWFSPIVDYVMGAGTLISGLVFRKKHKGEPKDVTNH